MADTHSFLRIASTRGGRNGYDSPHAIGPDQVVEALNVDWWHGECGQKRAGASAFSLTSAPFTGVLSSLIRHTATGADASAELWGIDSAAKVGRYASGAWSTITPDDAISTAFTDVVGASLNGKLFLAYNSAVDRLHVWDGTDLRRVGLPKPAAPTGANQGAGTYAAALRYYRVVWVQRSGSDDILRSEPSDVLSFTPSGTGASVRVTQPTPPGESETHWDLYCGLESDGNFYLVSENTIATTYYDHSGDVTQMSGADLMFDVGENIVPWSAKFVVTDENRLLMAGSFEDADYGSRLACTPVVGASGIGDDERLVQKTDVKHYWNLDQGDGGDITGLSGPMNGSPYAFKVSHIYKLVRTGTDESPYLPITISKTVGAIRHQTIVDAEDELGAPAKYFLSRRGPYRLGQRGLEFCGADVADIWETVNLDATSVVGHGVYHAAKQQVWWWVSTDGANDPNLKIVFDVREGRSSAEGVRRGWAKHNGASAAARCSVMYADSTGSADLKPYIGRSSGTAIWKCDADGTTDDAGTTFQAYQTTRIYPLAGMGVNAQVMEAHVVARAASGVTLTMTLSRDWGVDSRTATVSLTAVGSETHVQRQFASAELADAGVVQFTVGDASAVANAWVLDALIVKHRPQVKR